MLFKHLMLQKLKKIFKPDLRPLNSIKISKSKILHNLDLIQQRQSAQAIFPVLKSNAYGHGILQILEILRGQSIPYLAVDSFPEYQIIARNSRFNILIMGETLPQNYRFFDTKRTAFAVFSLPVVQALAALKSKVRVHLFLNTGMNREGIQEQNLPAFLQEIKKYPNIELEGVMSHLHSADTEPESIAQQVKVFKKMTKQIENAGFSPKWKHIAASAGTLQIQDDFFTACRPGLLLYGYSPMQDTEYSEKTNQLQPALNLFSTITAIQKVET